MIRSTSICLSVVLNYMKSEMSNLTKINDDGFDDLTKKASTLKCLKETFEQFGGVFSKISQLLNIEDNLSDSKVYSECKPVNREKTIDFLKNEFITNSCLIENVKDIDFNVFKSGSVGQVHKAKLQNGTDIVIKVQYVGLDEQIKSDLALLNQIINFLYSFADLTDAMKDIKTKMTEELDYRNESMNQELIYNLWNNFDNNIKITKLVPNICTKKILGIYYIEGQSLHEFIMDSTDEEKQFISRKLIKFIFTNIYKNKLFYSDIHYGNFLIQNKNTLYVMDFGCLSEVSDELLENLKNIYKSLKLDNKPQFYEAVKNIGFINDSISDESKEYIYEYMKLQYSPWISETFNFDKDFLSKASYKNTTLMREWKVPPSMVYFNKIPFGLFHVLTKLNASGNFSKIFEDLIMN